MVQIEVIAEFKIDSTIKVLRILLNNEVYDLSFKLLCQWIEENCIHIISICEDKEQLLELKFDRVLVWEVLNIESLY